MDEIKDYQLLQTRFNLSNTLTQIRYTIFNDTFALFTYAKRTK